VNIPKVATGTTTAIQSTQNTALSQTDLTTNALSSSIVTIGGKQVVSQQLLDQGGLPVDEVVLSDLAADLTKQVDQQSLSGTGSSGQIKGVLNAGGTAITYTDAAPTQAKVFNQIIKAKNAVEVGRYLPATAILMHPTRWDWFLEWVDGQQRPMVVPDGPSFNGAGTMTGQAAQGSAGTLAGLPVFLDAQMPVNQGAGTNQDSIVVARWEELMLWESTPVFEAFQQPYADSMGVLFRAYGYFAAIPNRYTAAVSVIGGTGLVLPSL
jgi:HK97 family phage major capsid protein